MRNYILPFVYSLTSMLHAGQMAGEIGVQTYRDLATNSGIFEAGATDVPIYNAAGDEIIGYLPLVPDFSATAGASSTAKGGALAGGKQAWVTSAAHVGNQGTISFQQDSNLINDTVFGEQYQSVSTYHLTGGGALTHSNDMTVSRLSKLATDAVGWDYAPEITSSILSDALIMRAGFGAQTLIPESGGSNQHIAGSNSHLTAGMVDSTSVQEFTVTATAPGGSAKQYTTTYISYTQREIDAENPITIGALMGDSGSPVIYYDKAAGQWYYIGATRASSVDKEGVNQASDSLINQEWAYDVQDAHKVYIDDTEGGTYTITRDESTGMLTFAGSGGETIRVQALSGELRGDTSTIGTRASNTQLNAGKDWIMSHESSLRITSSIDTGAGAIYFHRARELGTEGITNYHLSASQSDLRLNTAGYLIQERVEVISELTGAAGDEWRIVGDAGKGGLFVIQGEGDNAADLNLGVGVTAVLDRSAGYAAHDLKVSTGATAIFAQDDALSGGIVFGQGGGTIDLAGTQQHVSSLQSLETTSIVGSSQGHASLHIQSESDGDYHGSFHDAQALGQGTGSLTVRYEGSSSSTLHLHADSHITGELSISGGRVVLESSVSSFTAARVIVERGGTLDLASAKGALNAELHLHGILETSTAQTINKAHFYEGHQIVLNAESAQLLLVDPTFEAGSTLSLSDQIRVTGNVTLHNLEWQQASPLTRSTLLSPELTLVSGIENLTLDENSTLTLILSYEMIEEMELMGGRMESISLNGMELADGMTLNISAEDAEGNLLEHESMQNLTWSADSQSVYVGDGFTDLLAVPEPSQGALALIGLLGALRHRRRCA